MSTLQAANIVFESTGNTRFQYAGSNTVNLIAAGNTVATVNSSAIAVGGVSHTAAGITFADATSQTTGFTKANTSQAQAGTDDTTIMTPLKTASAITALGKAPDVIAEYQLASGTYGGTGTTTTYQTRPLNTLVRNINSIASLTSNQITLPAGTYYASFSSPAYNSSSNRTRLYNITDSTLLILGSSEYSGAATQNRSIGSGTFTLAASKAIAVQHYTYAAPTNGWGQYVGSGDVEIYTRIEIWKIG